MANYAKKIELIIQVFGYIKETVEAITTSGEIHRAGHWISVHTKDGGEGYEFRANQTIDKMRIPEDWSKIIKLDDQIPPFLDISQDWQVCEDDVISNILLALTPTSQTLFYGGWHKVVLNINGSNTTVLLPAINTGEPLRIRYCYRVLVTVDNVDIVQVLPQGEAYYETVFNAGSQFIFSGEKKMPKLSEVTVYNPKNELIEPQTNLVTLSGGTATVILENRISPGRRNEFPEITPTLQGRLGTSNYSDMNPTMGGIAVDPQWAFHDGLEGLSVKANDFPISEEYLLPCAYFSKKSKFSLQTGSVPSGSTFSMREKLSENTKVRYRNIETAIQSDITEPTFSWEWDGSPYLLFGDTTNGMAPIFSLYNGNSQDMSDVEYKIKIISHQMYDTDSWGLPITPAEPVEVYTSILGNISSNEGIPFIQSELFLEQAVVAISSLKIDSPVVLKYGIYLTYTINGITTTEKQLDKFYILYNLSYIFKTVGSHLITNIETIVKSYSVSIPCPFPSMLPSNSVNVYSLYLLSAHLTGLGSSLELNNSSQHIKQISGTTPEITFLWSQSGLSIPGLRGNGSYTITYTIGDCVGVVVTLSKTIDITGISAKVSTSQNTTNLELDDSFRDNLILIG